MKWRTLILVGVGGFLVLCIGLTLARSNHWFLPPAAIYSLEVTYTKLPGNDEAIGKWLKEHPGWRNVAVNRVGNKISFRFWTEQAPQLTVVPELMGECGRLGYEGLSLYSGTMVDKLQRGTRWHSFYVEFGELPEDDTVVASWLQAQSQVRQLTVSRDGKVVLFEFELESPPPPTILADILKKCEESGYQGRKGFFHAFGRYR